MSPRPAFTALFRRRELSARVRFVAALYEARGSETAIEGRVVTVDGERVLVASRWDAVVSRWDAVVARVIPRRVVSPSRVDRVVAIDPARAARLAARYDARPVSAADLDSLARYGLDRQTADELYREQFGTPVAAVEPAVTSSPSPTSSPPTDASQSGSEPHRLSLRPGFVTALVVLVLSGVVLFGVGATATGAPWVWDAPETVSVSTAVPSSPAASPTPSPDEATTTASRFDGDGYHPPGPDGSVAPGVSPHGITDLDALASAHAAVLSNHSYRWELRYVERVNETITARGTETVRVSSPRRFVSTVDWRGSPVGFSPVASRSSYADGSVRYSPAVNGSGVVGHPLGNVSVAGEQGWRGSRAVGWYLSATSSRVERTLIHAETPTAVVVATGATYPSAADYTVRAHVTSDGFVQSLTVSYVLTGRTDGPPVDVTFTFRYLLDEDVSVSPPPWYTTTETPASD